MKKYITSLFIIIISILISLNITSISLADDIKFTEIKAEISELEKEEKWSLEDLDVGTEFMEIEYIVENDISIAFDKKISIERILKIYNYDESELGILSIFKGSDGEFMDSGYSIHAITDDKIIELTSCMGETAYKLANLIYSNYLKGNKIYYEFMDCFYIKDKENLINLSVINDEIYYKKSHLIDFEKKINIDNYDILNKLTENDGHSLSLSVDFEKEEILKYNIVNMEEGGSKLNADPIPGTTIASLKKWRRGEFLPIYDLNNNGPLYAGDQSWLSYKNVIGNKAISEYWANRSCGVTAAANAAAYLDSTGSTKYSSLYQYGAYDIKRYTSHMREVYDYLTPAIWGIPSAQNYWERLESFGKSRGVNLRSYYITQGNDLQSKVNFIKNGLNANTPISMLTMVATGGFESDQGYSFNNHWVTITRLYKSGSFYGVNVSSWAMMQTVNLNYWHNRLAATKTLTYTN